MEPIASQSERAKPPPSPSTPRGAMPGTRQAVFPLREGDVTLTFPHDLSSSSASALTSYVTLFLEQARQAAVDRERLEKKIRTPT